MYLTNELELIRWIHTFRTEGLDRFFLLLNTFDRFELLYLVLPVTFLFAGWRRTYELLLLLFISTITTTLLKNFFDSPRPLHLDQLLGLIHSSSGGFPSGAAQTIAILSMLLIEGMQSSWKWLLIAPLALLLSFSRLYLGAHFLFDLFGGFAVGYALYRLFYRWKGEVISHGFLTLFLASSLFFGGITLFLPHFRLFALLTFGATLSILMKTKSRFFSSLSRTKSTKAHKTLS